MWYRQLQQFLGRVLGLPPAAPPSPPARIERRVRPGPGIEIPPELRPRLETLAAREGQSVESFTQRLLYQATHAHWQAVTNLIKWEALTPREQQVAAFVCLGYTNQMIADEMILSINTIKTHIRHILTKFEVNSKHELQQALAGWDFDSWLDGQGFE